MLQLWPPLSLSRGLVFKTKGRTVSPAPPLVGGKEAKISTRKPKPSNTQNTTPSSALRVVRQPYLASEALFRFRSTGNPLRIIIDGIRSVTYTVLRRQYKSSRIVRSQLG